MAPAKSKSAPSHRAAKSLKKSDRPNPKSKLDLSPMRLWRVAFYLLMVHNWHVVSHGPFDSPWERAMGYYHAEWALALAPTTEFQSNVFLWGGTVAAILSTFNDLATIPFAFFTCQYVLTSVTRFVNHDYLFALLSVLMALYCNSRRAATKRGWVHAMRGQIVVVYAFASLWKFSPDWLDGTIVKSIFLSFEEQGVARGVPWKALHEAWPQMFPFLALSGFFLDSILFLTLMFLPPGHWLQYVSLIFHSFTGFTMSQRIGYAFPIGMILAGLIFQPMKDEETPQCHARWFLSQLSNVPRKEFRLPVLWLVVQWALPLRMPIVSHMAFKHTMEGYRWSWTMMLHTKSSLVQPGMTFVTLRPKCGREYFPNPVAANNDFSDPQSFPYEQLLGARQLIVAQLFPRQLPKIADTVHSFVKDACKGKDLSVVASVFSRTNEGPYHRIVDPTVDLVSTHRALVGQPYPAKLWLSLVDKVPKGHEFLLKNIGSAFVPRRAIGDGWIVVVDRTPCLNVDPIRIHNVHFDIEVLESRFPLQLKACSDATEQECKEVPLEKGQAMSAPPIRRLTIEVKASWAPIDSCSDSSEEDIVLRLRPHPQAWSGEQHASDGSNRDKIEAPIASHPF